jgi:hypothetical protein
MRLPHTFGVDFTGDGGDHLGGVEASIGTLYLYKGHGGGAIDGGSPRGEIGCGGWNGISDCAGGDFTGGRYG